MISAFGVEHEVIAKKAKAVKMVSRANKTLRFDRAGRMFGTHTNKAGETVDSAFTRGQKKGWKKGYGPMRSAFRGLTEAAQESPGTAGLAGIGAVGAVGGTGYIAGRAKDR